jgi:hypothetical protein
MMEDSIAKNAKMHLFENNSVMIINHSTIKLSFIRNNATKSSLNEIRGIEEKTI